MSLPARELPSPRPPRGPRSEPARVLTPKRRKQHQVGFAVLASVVVGLLVLSIVVLHVLLAQQSFRIDEVERRAEVLRQEHLGLVTQQATLSAPGRIAAWAARHGMRLPDDIRILRASDDPGDPTGTGSASVGEERR